MFKGRHFDRSVILLCVRWYLAYGLRWPNGASMWTTRRFIDGSFATRPSCWSALMTRRSTSVPTDIPLAMRPLVDLKSASDITVTS
jgi:hypothetical protein